MAPGGPQEANPVWVNMATTTTTTTTLLGFEKLIALLGFEKLIALPGAGKQGHRAPTELSNTALCSIFYVDSENGIESLPGPRFSSKIDIFAHFG